MINASPRHSSQLQCLLGTVGQAQEPDIQRVTQRVGHVDTATGGGPGELFDEVGDALAAFVDKINHHVAGRSLQQLGQQFGDLSSLEAENIDAYGAREATNLCEEGTQRMAPGELIAAVGG